MYPVAFDPKRLRVVLVGDGEAACKRLKGLDGSAAEDVTVFSPTPSVALREGAGRRLKDRLPDSSDLEGVHLCLIAGLDDAEAGRIAGLARAAGCAVNVEDRPALCDFHVPAVVRRGDLVLTVSTSGRSPGLAVRMRRRLEELFGPEWAGRLDEIAAERDRLRAEGADMKTLRRAMDEWIDRRGWFG